jgi:Aldo/keto reductase family
MQYRRIGNTDTHISEVGFGCGGNAGLMVRGESRDQIRTIACALELGVTYFDNAPDYGAGRAEENLGRALKAIGARPVINSKVEIRAVDLGDIAGQVVRSAEQSLSRIGIEQLDVFQVHNGPSLSRPLLEEKVYRQLWLEDFLRAGRRLRGYPAPERARKNSQRGIHLPRRRCWRRHGAPRYRALFLDQCAVLVAQSYRRHAQARATGCQRLWKRNRDR